MVEQADRLLTTRQIAQRLNVSIQTVSDWVAKGKLKGLRAGPRMWRINESDLEKFLAECQR